MASSVGIYISGLIIMLSTALFWSFAMRDSLKYRFTHLDNVDIDAKNIHIGVFSGVAVDMANQTILYSRGLRLHTLSVADVFRDESAWTNLSNKSKNRQKFGCSMRFQTNRVTCPEVEVTFWLRSQFDKLKETLSTLRQAHELTHDATKRKENKRITHQEQKVSSRKLATFLSKKGFTAFSSPEDVNPMRVGDAVETMYDNFEEICGLSLEKQGIGVVMIAALNPIMAKNPNDPTSIGFEPSTLENYVYKELGIVIASREKTRKNKG